MAKGKGARKPSLKAALAAATTAFLSVPAAAIESQTSVRAKRRIRVRALRPPVANGGPFILGEKTEIRVGAWRPAGGGNEAAEAKIRIFDAVSSKMIRAVNRPIAPGEGFMIKMKPVAGVKMVAFEGTLVTKGDTCNEKLVLKLTFEAVDGESRSRESAEVMSFKCAPAAQKIRIE